MGKIKHGESITDRVLAGTKVSEAETVKLDLQELLVLTEIADVIGDSNLESNRGAEIDIRVAISPSIVTETPEVIEQTRNVTDARQSVVKKSAKETEQRVLKQKV